jgi:hypothetical protein
MSASLPTLQELEKLPMRAVVAYAARTARRLTSELRGIVADEILDDALRLIGCVATNRVLAEIDPASVVRAGERVASAYAAAPDSVKSQKAFRIVFSLAQATLAGMYVLLAVIDPSSAQHQMKSVAQTAERAVRPIGALDSQAADAARNAARRDYEILVTKYGRQDAVVIGDPVDCFDAL